VRDVGIAEELAQDALVAALKQWPQSGIPNNPGAWLMAAAKHRAIGRKPCPGTNQNQNARSNPLHPHNEPLPFHLNSRSRAALDSRRHTTQPLDAQQLFQFELAPAFHPPPGTIP